MMKLEIEEGHYYLMKDGEDFAIATTDESFIREIGAARLSRKNCDKLDIKNDVYIETIEYGLGNDENGRPVFETRPLLDSFGCLILKSNHGNLERTN